MKKRLREKKRKQREENTKLIKKLERITGKKGVRVRVKMDTECGAAVEALIGKIRAAQEASRKSKLMVRSNPTKETCMRDNRFFITTVPRGKSGDPKKSHIRTSVVVKTGGGEEVSRLEVPDGHTPAIIVPPGSMAFRDEDGRISL